MTKSPMDGTSRSTRRKFPFVARRYRLRNALLCSLLLLVGCTQPTPTPHIVMMYPEEGTVGRLVYQDGCWRLGQKDGSVQLIWPQNVQVRLEGTTVHIEKPDGPLTLRLGDTIWLQGELLPTYRNKRNRQRIEAFRRQGQLPAHCPGPYELVRQVTRWIRVAGQLQKEDGCWYLQDEGGRTYALVLQRPLQAYKETLYYVEWKERRGYFLRSGDRLSIEGRVYPRIIGKESTCSPPYLITDVVSLPGR